MPASEQGLDRLVAGFEEAGYEVRSRRGTYPSTLELLDLADRGEAEHLTVYLRLLRPGGHGPREGSMRMWLPARPPRADDEPQRQRSLTLGYEPALDVFAGWPNRDPRLLLRPSPRHLWVPHGTLLEAAESGFAAPRRTSAAFAFRAERVREYLAADAAAVLARWVGQWDRLREVFDSSRGEYRRYSGVEIAEGVDLEMEEFAMADEPPPRRLPTERRPSKEVETGFAPAGRLAEQLSPQLPLAAATDYLYWFGIGAETGASIETTPVPPPEDLPDGARLAVQLFPFDRELELAGPTLGEVELLADGSARVTRPAAIVAEDDPLQRSLLAFPVRTPQRPGLHRLRCNLYYGSTLLQSRLVSAQVGGEADPERPALRSDLDYSLAAAVDLASLAQVPEHDLSLMVNGSGGAGEGGGGLPVAAATHQFGFFHGGEEQLTENASLGAPKIAKAIGAVRGALRRASWETEAEWDEEADAYRYEQSPGDEAKLTEDLVRMAIRGHRLYVDITRELSGGKQARRALERVTRESLRIQIATANSGLYVPAALFYDHPLEGSPSPQSMGKFKLCGEFLRALDAPEPLEESACIDGRCPHRDERFVVCPSGFWGYRHEIGWPVGGRPDDDDAPVKRVEFSGKPELAIGVSTDPRLEHRRDHVERVLAMGSGEAVESRDDFRDLVKSVSPHLVYLYCHGGLSAAEGAPFLILGPLESDGLDGTYLVDEEIEWGNPPPRPVVFINGCHTTALEPAQLGDLVDGFVKDAKAIGVLGTEVTIFEPLARSFAEQMLPGFLDGRMTIGAAIRHARFELLRARNPLGLVYVPFIAADTQLVPV